MKYVLILTFILLAGCASSQKIKPIEGDYYAFTDQSLKSYQVFANDNKWVGCDSDYIKSQGTKEEILPQIYQNPMTEVEKQSCAKYVCENDYCSSEGEYIVFSKIVNFYLKRHTISQFTSEMSKFEIDLNKESEKCFQIGDKNSCALLGAFYRYKKFNRNKYYQVRLKECELLEVNQRNCNFDY